MPNPYPAPREAVENTCATMTGESAVRQSGVRWPCRKTTPHLRPAAAPGLPRIPAGAREQNMEDAPGDTSLLGRPSSARKMRTPSKGVLRKMRRCVWRPPLAPNLSEFQVLLAALTPARHVKPWRLRFRQRRRRRHEPRTLDAQPPLTSGREDLPVCCGGAAAHAAGPAI